MPQLSFDPKATLEKVTIKLGQTRDQTASYVEVVATNRAGDMLASAMVLVNGHEEAELVPLLLSQVAYGWLYGSPAECVTQPISGFRSSRKALRERLSKGLSPRT